ncbi:Transposase and inactivated derivatives [Haemophilus pittmaniae]|uniref:Transposase and inactivated derivatives n=2 Tax=Haemophilus pittmaniae TaxID=249188 RepID=A0A377IW10_9PAST|nr:Transposase and inactivated derivatives [Haemophilus pittmaniae]
MKLEENIKEIMIQSTYRRQKHLRLPCYDYSQYGCYFVTICTKHRQLAFGEIIDSEMKLNVMGNIAEEILLNLTEDYPNSLITDYVIMPNHLHFIWFNQDDALLSNVVKKLKGNIAKRYHDIMKFPNQVYIPLWQRSFYEHIIRDDKDYERIAEYIQNNPLQWQLDRFYIP